MSSEPRPRAPRDIVEHVLRANDVADASEVAQEVVNEFTDAEVVYFALYRGYECAAMDDDAVGRAATPTDDG